MRYFIYKITNRINNKFYIGAHATKNISDNYMGSGSVLKKAFKKYGIHNFDRDIIYTFNDEQSMYEKEAEIVNEEFINRNDTYNLKLGGQGGWSYINDNKLNQTEKNRLSSLKNLEKANKKNKELFEQGLTRKGHKLSQEHKNKISDKLTGLNVGEKNHIYGKKSINKDGINKLVKKEDLDQYLSDGWSLGQIQNKPDFSGENNPQTGKIWITDGANNKCITTFDAAPYLKNGWFKGRTLKKYKN